ncbi:centrosomal protein of 85 kDa-like [Stegastes partitus]|uniref:Centrosomal protein of 85 kDa-like n=1 Tax=Stegastes partitus TaxID=144197 RepID=A0A9Y4KPG0_9TELE|nr:PREDICTED: centrosomal protein of 85 kDa-like [Stegastes partitus]
MWSRTDLEDGYESNKTASSGGSPGWTPDSAWSSSGGRRLSAVSDSGDTGIGTYCSDSVEDDSSCSTTPLSFLPLSQHHLDDDGVPVLPVLPSPSSSPGARLRVPASPHSSGRWVRSPLAAPSCLDMKDQQPIRRWSSLTKLSSDRRTSGLQSGPEGQGSLDRGLLYGYRKGSNVDLYLPLSSSFICSSFLQRSPGAGPGYRYDRSGRSPGLEPDRPLSSALSSPVRHHNLDMNYGALPEAQVCQGGGQVSGLGVPLPPPADRRSPIQPAVRTQMWLTEQMEYRPDVERGAELGTEVYGGDGLSPWQPGLQPEPGLNQWEPRVFCRSGVFSTWIPSLCFRQKQQILQLHARIRENELRAQQVLQSQRGWLDDLQVTPSHSSSVPSSQTCRTKLDPLLSLLQDPRMSCKQSSSRICCDEDLRGKLAVAELEVLHLNEFFKQVTQKYSEDVRKLEEKIKTRDRYISSLKKKCQRETDQNQEKQQRIETLEKYLSDLPTLEEVQVQQQQQQQVQLRVEDLQKAVVLLQRSLDEGSALMKQKELKMELQNQREKELMASVHSLQQKVQQCLDDGVRLPVQDLKRLEVENSQLLQLQNHSSRLFKHQKEQIDRLTSQLTATSSRLQEQRGVCDQDNLPPPPRAFTQEQRPADEAMCPWSHVEIPELGRLLKEMSLCLLDLQGLCSILAQRAQGKEPNLTLLLGMKSLSVSAEDSDCEVKVVEEELRFKLLEVGQLRRDIDDLRRSISDRYAQYMGDSCVSQ